MQFAMLFSDDQCLVAFWRCSRSSSEVVQNRAEILMFLVRQILMGEEGPSNFLAEFYKYGSPSNDQPSDL